MIPWFKVVEPHRDIKERKFSESVFAADLGNVVQGTAPPDYNDPYVFASNTYFTEGITRLLRQVNRKLTKGEGPGVIEIQTPFGGGKTHALISIYHYIKNSDKIINQLPKGLDQVKAETAVIVGTHLNPLEGRKIENITLKTLWGELAYQLEGEKGYKEFKENDQKRIAPGKDKLKNFLEKHQPFVLLFDEVLEYVAKALDVENEIGNLGGQTFAFLQELTETIASMENAMLVVTLPSSELEDFTGSKEHGLERLNKIFGRIETIISPVSGTEIYSIIRKRLFQEIKDENEKAKTIHRYFDFYQDRPDDVPRKVRSPDFRDAMELAYPFHPDTIDLLYEKWGTFSSFQRTRGVLRLLANVIGDIYQERKNIDIILPSDVNLGNDGIRYEFLKHLEHGYESIIASDISGPQAKAQILDKQHPEWDNLAEKIATAIFLHSFTVDSAERGIALPYIKMTTLRPDILPATITEILQSRLTGIQGALWYLNEREDTFFFSNIPSLRKILRDKIQLMGDLSDEIKTLIENEAGKAVDTYVWPRSSNDVPDNRRIKLVLVDSKFKDQDIDDWVDKKGENFRVYKNTVVFALPDTSSYYSLLERKKELEALKDTKREIKSGLLKSLESHLDKIDEDIKRIETSFSYNIRYAYRKIYVGKSLMDSTIPSTGKEDLSTWIKRELTSNDKIASNLHYNIIDKKIMEKVKKLKTETIREQFYKNLDLPMIESDDVIRDALRRAVKEGAFALAIMRNGEIQENTVKYNKGIAPSEVTFDQDEYLLKKDEIVPHLCAVCGSLKKNGVCPNICTSCGTHLVNGICPNCTVDSNVCLICGEAKVNGKCLNLCSFCGTHLDDSGACPNTCPECGTHLVDGICPKCEGEEDGTYKQITMRIEDLSTLKIADIHRGILQPISRDIGEFKFTIEFSIVNPDGVDKNTVDSLIKEAVNQLGATITKEEKA